MGARYTRADPNWKSFLGVSFADVEGRGFPANLGGMKQILIIGASGGVGSALATAYAARGDQVTGLSRSVDGLDLTDEASVEAHIGRLDGPFDVVIVASGALEIDGAEPEKTIKSIRQKTMMDQFALNAVGPALVLRHAPDLLPRDGRGVLQRGTDHLARVGSIGDNKIGGWISYRSAKAALNQIIRTGAIELARSHKHSICVALHPGTVKTPFTEKYLARHPAVEASAAAENIVRVIDGLGAEDTGEFFDWAGSSVPW